MIVEEHGGISFFDSQAEFRGWLEVHHTDTAELVLGFWRTGLRAGISYSEARDQALCFGWIDGIGPG